MTTLLLILWTITVICLVLHTAVHVRRTKHSRYELKRRGDNETLRREKLLADVIAVRYFAAIVVVIIMTTISLTLWQWWGIVISILVVLFSMTVSRLSFIQHAAQRMYRQIEPRLLQVSERVPFIGWVLGSDRTPTPDQRIESPEHLLHLVETAGHVLSPDQQMIIRRGLDWHTTAVEAIMIHRKDIVSVKFNELLGPLVLNDLHTTGFSRFPVTRGDIDTIVGVLSITDLLEVDSGKRSQTAEKSMSSQVLHIESDEALPVALALIQKSHQHVLIVIDKEGKTVGMVTLTDITKFLLSA